MRWMGQRDSCGIFGRVRDGGWIGNLDGIRDLDGYLDVLLTHILHSCVTLLLVKSLLNQFVIRVTLLLFRWCALLLGHVGVRHVAALVHQSLAAVDDLRPVPRHGHRVALDLHGLLTLLSSPRLKPSCLTFFQVVRNFITNLRRSSKSRNLFRSPFTILFICFTIVSVKVIICLLTFPKVFPFIIILVLLPTLPSLAKLSFSILFVIFYVQKCAPSFLHLPLLLSLRDERAESLQQFFPLVRLLPFTFPPLSHNAGPVEQADHNQQRERPHPAKQENESALFWHCLQSRHTHCDSAVFLH